MPTPLTLPKTVSCFGVIIENNQIPPRIYMVHNTADPVGPNGEEGKPNGWGLPGGGSLGDEKPNETVRREVLGEAGLATEIATRGKDSEFGEILFEHKPNINNEIYIFHLKKIDDGGFRNIEETNETRRVMLADLGSILKMPLAVKLVRQTNSADVVAAQKIKNPEGIYFSTRERIFGVLNFLGYDFYKLIPDLDDLIKEINREEVGDYVYNLLAKAIGRKNEAYEHRAKFLRPDDEELLERYDGLLELYKRLTPLDALLQRYQPWATAATQEKK